MTRLSIKRRHFFAYLAASVFCLSISGQAIAVDDGARAYWKMRDGSHVVSAQYLSLDLQATGAQSFDPASFIYPNADTEANIILLSYAYHTTLFGRPSSFAVNLVGGSAEASMNTLLAPVPFLPPGVAPGAAFSQSTSGFGDPTVQLDVNLFGTPPLVSNVDLLNYEPSFTIDAALLLAAPIGEYSNSKLVNLGLNRFYGRIALPMKLHLGAFARGYMTSVEVIPSVWLFDDNKNFLGQSLENDPLWQIEGHVTRDFTRTLSGSLDILYRHGFQSKINGVQVGEILKVGDVGLSLTYQVTDNIALRSSFSTILFGNSDIDNSIVRLQLIYGWHRLNENAKKLTGQGQ